MGIFDAIFQGFVQGLTEFLPVSSSGHLSLVQYFTGNSGDSGFLFSILLHAGTLIAVCLVFWRTILELFLEFFYMIGDIFRGRFSFSTMPAARRMLLMLIVSTLPLGLMLLFKDAVARFSQDNDIVVEGICFLITGTLLLMSSSCRKGWKNAKNTSIKDALVVGAAQVAATMPGISRSGSTISSGMMMGFEQAYAVSYSFILGIPAVLGAIILEVGDAVEQGTSLPTGVVIAGLLSSALFGILAIKLVQWVVKGNKLKYFGYYTIALGVLTVCLGIFEMVSGHQIQQFFSSL